MELHLCSQSGGLSSNSTKEQGSVCPAPERAGSKKGGGQLELTRRTGQNGHPEPSLPVSKQDREQSQEAPGLYPGYAKQFRKER